MELLRAKAEAAWLDDILRWRFENMIPPANGQTRRSQLQYTITPPNNK